MKKLKKFFKKLALCAILPCCLVLSACGVREYNFDKLGGGLKSNVEISSVDTSNIQTNLKSAVSTYTNNLASEQTITNSSSYDDTNTATIESAGSYYYTGTINSSITIKNSGVVHLYFNNVSLTNAGSKVIDAKSGVDLIITLIGQNSISNASETSANAISTSGNLTINGEGSLNIESTKSGIKCDGIFYGLGGNITITAQNHGISADSIYLDGANISIDECGKDGLHAESDYDKLAADATVPVFDYTKGFVFISGGTTVDIENCYGDGIQADSFVYIKSGTVNISTEAEFEQYTATSGGETGCYSKSGSTYTKVASDSVEKGHTYYKLQESVKGIKVGEIDYYFASDSETEYNVASSNYTILIEGGTIDIESTDDSIHSNSGNVFVYGGSISASTSDDGIHADTNLVVGSGSINISKSYEGLEGQAIEISGGNIVVVASDDGINAADSDLSETAQKTVCQILISGGKTYVSSGGDGVDSNGGIKITGGELYVSGPTSGADAALDSESGIVINGGIVIAVGTKGMVETPSTSSTQCAISINLSSSRSGSVSIKNSNEETLASFSPSLIFGSSKSYSSIVISCPEIAKGSKYTIITGTSSTSVKTSSNSTITTSGNSAGGPIK